MLIVPFCEERPMKKSPLFALIVILFVLPSPGYSSYRIQLKSGGEYITEQYEISEGQITFTHRGGTVSLPASIVHIVDESTLTAPKETKSDRSAPKDSATGAENLVEDSLQEPDSEPVTASDGKRVDLKVYTDENQQLKGQLDAALGQWRLASRNGDDEGKEEARQKITEIQSRIYKLTDELKEKNGGVLPGDWFSFVDTSQ
jgi:hypothetical protein